MIDDVYTHIHRYTWIYKFGEMSGEINKEKMATSVIRIKKICAWCGKEFEAQKLSTQFCSHRCSSLAYKDKKRQEKKQRAETASQRSQQKKKVEDIKDKEYLTVSEAAQLLGFTRDGVYKLIYQGLLKAHRITSHWTVIYRKNIDEMITARPIDPSGISKKDRKPITEFYTTKEVLEKFSISNSWLFKAAKQQNIPKVTQHGKTYWSKKHCDMIFGKKDTSVEEITEWYSVAEIQEIFGMTLPAIYCLVSKTGIPKKKEGKEVRYSKKHFDAAKGIAEPVEPEWYSIAEATEKFNMSRDQLHYYIKTYKVKKKMVGKYCYLAKDEVDALFENIFTPPSI